MTLPLQGQSNPYVGPRAFETGERLYGRSREARKLLNLLVAERIVLLHAPSGAGKTSLIQAELIPRLTAREFRVLPPIRLNADLPAANRYLLSTQLALEERLPNDQRLPAEILAGLTLSDYLEQRVGDSFDGTVLIFDQFEEVLTLDPTDKAVKEQFFLQLGRALEDRRRWALFAIRRDRARDLDAYVRPIPTQLARAFPLELLSTDAAHDAIKRPARDVGVAFSDQAATRLIDDLRLTRVQRADGTSEEQLGDWIEPVQLQVVCYRLWEQLPADAVAITEEEARGVGEVDSALADYYAERVQRIAMSGVASQRDIREWCENRLITVHDIRSQVLREPGSSGDLDNRAIQGLVDEHLVRGEQRLGSTWYELAHDRLIAPIHRSNANWREANLHLLQRQAALWERQNHPDGLLLRDTELREAEAWAEANPSVLSATDQEFLTECRAIRAAVEQERRSRRNRRLAYTTTVISMIVLVALIISIYYFLLAQAASGLAIQKANLAQEEAQRADAERARAVAESARAVSAETQLRLSSQALLNFEPKPQLGLLLAIESTRVVTTSSFVGSTDSDSELVRQGLSQMGGLPTPLQKSPARAGAYHPQGKWVALAVGHVVQLWEPEKLTAPLETLEDSSEDITALTFSPDGHWLAGASGTTVWLWDMLSSPSSPRTAHPLRGHQDTILSLAFSSDSRQLASGEEFSHTGGGVLLWQINKLDAPPRRIQVANGTYSALAFSPDGRQLAISAGYEIRLQDLHPDLPGEDRGDTGERVLQSSFGWVNALVFTPDGRQLISGGSAIQIFSDLSSTKIVSTTLSGHKAAIRALAVSSDGHWLASASDDYTARLWKLDDLAAPPVVLRGHEGAINSVVFSPNSRQLATASDDQTMRIWDIPDVAAEPLILRDVDDVSAVRLWRMVNGQPERMARTLMRGTAGAYDVQLSDDDRWLAAIDASRDAARVVWLWNLNDLDAPPQQLTHDGDPDPRIWGGPLFSPDKHWLATGSADGTIRLWDLTALDPSNSPRAWTAHDGPVRDLAFSGDGHRLVSAGQDGLAKVWDMTALEEASSPSVLTVLRGHTSIVRVCAISPDGHWVATGSWEPDNTVRLWNLSDATAEPIVLKFRGRLFDLDFSPDGRFVAAASWDNTIQVVDLTKTPLQPVALAKHQGRVFGVTFSQNSRQLFSGAEDRSVRIWDMYAADPALASLSAPYGAGKIALTRDNSWMSTGATDFSAVAFSRSGVWLATGTSVGQLYRMRREDLVAVACRTAGRNLTFKEWQQFFSSQPYRKTCPDLPIHPSVITGARELARGGSVEAVEMQLRQVLALELSTDLDPQTPERDSDPASVARRFVAAALVERIVGSGSNLVGTDVETVTVQLQRAHDLDPSIDLNPQTPERDSDPVAIARQLVASALIAAVEPTARQGKIDKALDLLHRAQALNPQLDVKGRVWSRLCRWGSLWGRAADVLSACERIVALAPDSGFAHDSRGLARALTGDLKGAAVDFREFVHWTEGDVDFVFKNWAPQREQWISALDAGRDPFDAQTLEELRRQLDEL